MLALLAPVAGWICALEEVPDAVFSQRLLGDGLAIDPVGASLHAPCDGEIISMARTGHAVSLRSDDGAEILMHVGLDTVAMKGDGFVGHVEVAAWVKAGDLLISFDLDGLARRAKSLLTPIVITNADAFDIQWRGPDRDVRVGDPFMTLARRSGRSGHATLNDEGLRRTVRLELIHGLHARPAARLSKIAQSYVSRSQAIVRDGTADARSPLALMTLDAVKGDLLTLVCAGPDAKAAMDALCSFLESAGGEATKADEPAVAQSSQPVDQGLLKGVAAAPGCVVGRVVRLKPLTFDMVEQGADPAAEAQALDAAIRTVQEVLSTATSHGPTARDVLLAHLEILNDSSLRAAANQWIGAGKSAGSAWGRAVDAQVETFRRLTDLRLRERVADLLDLKQRVFLALGAKAASTEPWPADAILLADDLLPSELLSHAQRIIGLCLAKGGATSHVALLAADLCLPAVVAAGDALAAVSEGSTVIVDGQAGTLNIDPGSHALNRARAEMLNAAAQKDHEVHFAQSPSRLRSGELIAVLANLAGAPDAQTAVEFGAEGCGLLRSEFLFMDRASPPDEEEQRALYQTIADVMGPRPMVVRTLDLGGDKPVGFMSLPFEQNPALGLRGVRNSLLRPDLLRTQLRAILRVNAEGGCQIMVPMITSLDELIAVRSILDEERARLDHQGGVTLGVMIETPAAAITAGLLADHADFFSLGTNDLSQYVLAMDRAHPSLAAQVDALHPAVLRLIFEVCRAAEVKRRPVSLCGGLASEPSAAPLIVGLGVGSLSATPSMIPHIKAVIARWELEDCRALAQEALAQASAGAVRGLLERARTDTEARRR